MSDKFQKGRRWNKGAQHQDERQTNDSRDRHDIANEIVIEFVVKCRVDRVIRVDQEQRIAVGRGLHDHFGPDIPTGARSIVDDERLAQSLVQPLADQSSEDIVRAARRKGNDQAPRTRWIGLCPRPARYCRNRGSARGQVQKIYGGQVADTLQQWCAMYFAKRWDRPPFAPELPSKNWDFGPLTC